ncbi:DNA fragmentation factor subunit beta-like [Mytilus galloprovincialis]|uniref:DFFB n=1 Tax=Mytilus edulis TaxID=6550 RepID=A0A8S3RPS7_MYTED|nr:unnamed protein product [Mytilus edulis]CAG2208795.1 DFF40 [Mytilus edulis]
MSILSRFLSLFNGGMRAYKIQDSQRLRRIGVTAKNLKELLAKGCEKLQINESEVTVVIEDDGTVVDDDKFFRKLPAQTVFVFLKKGENWRGAGALIHDALSKLYCASRKNEIANQIRDLLTDEDAPEKIHIISQYLEMLETNVDSEERAKHEDWFEGLNKKYKTKSEVMRHSAQTRVRSYFITAKEQIEKESDSDHKNSLISVMDDINNLLKKNDFNAFFFDRTSRGMMCDKKGWFTCEGPFDSKNCDKFHTINPYASRGYRQLFGLWNLDHIIEKSREVIPCLIEASKNLPKGKELNTDLLYKLLFTTDNLKLVQIGCHKKAARPSGNITWKDFCV